MPLVQPADRAPPSSLARLLPAARAPVQRGWLCQERMGKGRPRGTRFGVGRPCPAKGAERHFAWLFGALHCLTLMGLKRPQANRGNGSSLRFAPAARDPTAFPVPSARLSRPVWRAKVDFAAGKASTRTDLSRPFLSPHELCHIHFHLLAWVLRKRTPPRRDPRGVAC